MNRRRIFVYGAGGHGKVVADMLIGQNNGDFAGFVDDREELWGRKVLGFPVHGGGDWLSQRTAQLRIAVALGIGSAQSRQLILDRCSRWEVEIVTVVHARASVSKFAQLSQGTVVMAHAVIHVDANVGTGAIVNSGAIVEHDAHVGDFAHVAPNATMGGASRLGAFSHLGLGAAVLQCLRVGSHSVIGAGAVVTKDLPNDVVAVGVPARIHRHIERENLGAAVSACIE